MESSQIIKLDVQVAKSNAPTSQSAGGEQATDKASFSDTLTQAQPESKARAGSNSPETAAPKEAINSETKKGTPAFVKPTLISNGQDLPLANEAIDASLPVASNIQLTQQATPQQAPVLAAGVLTPLSTNQLKTSIPVKSGIAGLQIVTAKTDIVPETDVPLLARQGVKPVIPTINDESNLGTSNFFKQLQQPLFQKAAFELGVDASKVVDKVVNLLAGNDVSRSETSSAARTPDSSLNINLVSDPLKAASENLTRVTQTPKINLPLSDSNWGEEFTNRIAWLSKNNIRSAQIKITPAHLGPIEVRVSLQNDQAAVSFISNHAVVRDAIDSASARLRESFADSGFDNVDVDVSSREDMNKQKQAENDLPKTHQLAMSENEETQEEISLSSHNSDSTDWNETTRMGVDYFV